MQSGSKTGARKGGFRLKALPEDAYKGQQQKLKQNLIQKAKLKKNYARVLRQEDNLQKVENEQDRGRRAHISDNEISHAGSSSQKDSSVPEFTNFREEAVDEDSEKSSSPNQDQELSKDRSYRQRMKARKADPSATKVTAVRQARADDRAQLEAKRIQIDQRRQHRNSVNKRETSRTKKGQPLMKDRIKNILDKLQPT
ncbi:protein of unknown function [Taphrina deformans PYCC 5710]|uniref:rRNA-processing protein FYV7 n=1 Tax=Taphrina deformans (strain PYCC 5710 / ATCC 11124 / CBS 356.35 / IMI 108563 / JCM 9778 / NBRC 8474) TaxID=1097556 RepID=R4XEK4_TAPDE|nr:protein of unknown function [Taphrina deformans PYCC 5710]|eukprot:CCG84277.1 protein of unknown function [Taphrina deformans PYCC 5710]